jgi:hypothetical protein
LAPTVHRGRTLRFIKWVLAYCAAAEGGKGDRTCFRLDSFCPNPLCLTALCSTALCSTALCSTALCLTALCFDCTLFQLHFVQLHFVQLHFVQLHFVQLHFVQLHFVQLHFVRLHIVWLPLSNYIFSYNMLFYHILYYNMLFYHILYYNMLFYHILYYNMLFYHILSYNMLFYHILSKNTLFFNILSYNTWSKSARIKNSDIRISLQCNCQLMNVGTYIKFDCCFIFSFSLCNAVSGTKFSRTNCTWAKWGGSKKRQLFSTFLDLRVHMQLFITWEWDSVCT